MSKFVAAVVNHIITSEEERGGVLIFLPGVQEIHHCIEAVRGLCPGHQVQLLPLHANLSNEEQRRVFETTSKWKIIAATNVAEVKLANNNQMY